MCDLQIAFFSLCIIFSIISNVLENHKTNLFLVLLVAIRLPSVTYLSDQFGYSTANCDVRPPRCARERDWTYRWEACRTRPADGAVRSQWARDRALLPAEACTERLSSVRAETLRRNRRRLEQRARRACVCIRGSRNMGTCVATRALREPREGATRAPQGSNTSKRKARSDRCSRRSLPSEQCSNCTAVNILLYT